MRGSRIALAAGAMLIAFSGQSLAQTVQWTTGQLGGGWYTIGAGLASIIGEELPDYSIQVVPGGGVDNPTKIQEGISQIGMGLDFLSHGAAQGEEPYGQPHDKLRTIGAGWSPTPFHFIHERSVEGDIEAALSSGDIRIATNETGASDELTFRRVLDYYGTSYDEIRAAGGRIVRGSYDEMNNAFGNDQADYIFHAISLPGGAVVELAEGRREARLAPLPEALTRHLHETYGYSFGEIPAGTYSDSIQDGPVHTAIMDTIMLVSADVDEEIVYEITKALLKNRDKFADVHASLAAFDPETAWKNTPVPMHPGAERAYRELGYME